MSVTVKFAPPDWRGLLRPSRARWLSTPVCRRAADCLLGNYTDQNPSLLMRRVSALESDLHFVDRFVVDSAIRDWMVSTFDPRLCQDLELICSDIWFYDTFLKIFIHLNIFGFCALWLCFPYCSKRNYNLKSSGKPVIIKHPMKV